MKTLSLMLTLE